MVGGRIGLEDLIEGVLNSDQLICHFKRGVVQGKLTGLLLELRVVLSIAEIVVVVSGSRSILERCQRILHPLKVNVRVLLGRILVIVLIIAVEAIAHKLFI